MHLLLLLGVYMWERCMYAFLCALSDQRTTSDVTLSLSRCLRQGLSVLDVPYCNIPEALACEGSWGFLAPLPSRSRSSGIKVEYYHA